MPRSRAFPSAVVAVATLLAACGGGGGDGGSGPVVVDVVELTALTLPAKDCQTGALGATAYDAQGRPIVGGFVVTYSSTNPAVATVTQQGAVTATGAGNAFLKAAIGSVADSIPLTVADSQVVTFEQKTSDLVLGESDTLTVTAVDCRGAPRPSATGIAFTVVSPGPVTVSPSGVVTPMAPGQTWVRATWNGGSDSADVIVATHPAGTLGTPTLIPAAVWGVSIARDGAVYAALLFLAKVARIPSAGGSYTTIDVGSLPTDVVTTRDGLRAYVANQGSQSVGLIPLAAQAQTTTVSVAQDPYRVRRSRDGTRIYSTGNGGRLSVINAATGALMVNHTIQPTNNGIAEAPDGQSVFLSRTENGAVQQVALSNGQAIGGFITGGKPQDLAVSRDGSRLFVADEAGDSVQVWSLASGQREQGIQLGGPSFAMAMSPDGQRLYASRGGTIFIIDPATKTVLDSLNPGGTVRRIAFSAAGNRAVASNEGGWVDFID